MSSITVEHTNGSTPPVESWLQLTAHQFFSSINWDDNPPEIQELRLTTAVDGDRPLGLMLSVQQFFNTVNWDGSVVTPDITPTPDAEPTGGTNEFTLDSFSDLF